MSRIGGGPERPKRDMSRRSGARRAARWPGRGAAGGDGEGEDERGQGRVRVATEKKNKKKKQVADTSRLARTRHGFSTRLGHGLLEPTLSMWTVVISHRTGPVQPAVHLDSIFLFDLFSLFF